MESMEEKKHILSTEKKDELGKKNHCNTRVEKAT